MGNRYTLCGTPTSGPVYKVALALALIGQDYAYRFVDFSTRAHKAPEYLAISRYGQVPALVAFITQVSQPIMAPEGVVIGCTLTQEDLAKMVGATRQWVSSSLKRLREDGVAEVTATRILIRDMECLRALGG